MTSLMNIESLLASYSVHQLQEVREASLMNRIDTKFMIPISLLSKVLEDLRSDYTALEINGHRVFTYENTYYDTSAFRFYHMHHNGKLNRFKVRYRKYREANLGFLEVKLKNNKKRTIKTRIQVDSVNFNDQKINDFLIKELQGNYHFMETKLFNSYQRISLMNSSLKERVTIDFNISFDQCIGKASSQLRHMFIAELKQEDLNRNSPFYRVIRRHHLRPVRFSKYCIGCCLTYPTQVKTNNFKPVLFPLVNQRLTERVHDH